MQPHLDQDPQPETAATEVGWTGPGPVTDALVDEPGPGPAIQPEPEVQAEPATEAAAEPETEPATETEPANELEPATEMAPAAETEPATEAEPRPEPEAEPEHGAEAEAASQPETPIAEPRTVAELIAATLRGAGVRLAVTVPGESFLPVLDALEAAGIRIVATRH